MKEVLDKNYVNELKILKFDAAGSGFLSVSQDEWKTELYKLERMANAGCLIAFFLFVAAMFLPFSGKLYVFGLGLFIAFFVRNTNGIKYANLKAHGAYNYEVHKTKVVRYSDVNFLKFDFSEVEKIKKKKFGIVLYKSRDINSYLLSDTKKELMVIPNKVQGYDQIVRHLVNEKVL